MRAYRLCYDGTSYHGFQRQPDVETVEDTLFDALRSLGVFPADAEKPPGYAAAGRTDAGVSARAQTVAFEAPDWLTPRAVNSELPAEIRAWASATVPPDFHATHDASSRTYTYFLHAPDASVEQAREAARRFVGTHDVHNLTTDDELTVREVSAVTVRREGPFLLIVIEAPGFCRQQVRRSVSLLADVARGEADLDQVDTALSETELRGPDGIAPLSAEPLVLADVTYPGVEFETDEDAASSARQVFDQLRINRLTGAQVAAALTDGV